MKAWEHLLSDLEDELGSSIADRWLKSLKVIRFDAANLYLEACDPLHAAWFEEHIRPRLKKRGFLNENHRPVKIHLSTSYKSREFDKNFGGKPTQPKTDSSSSLGIETANSKKSQAVFPSLTFTFRQDALDPACKLNNFVVFPGNAIAHKLLCEWADTKASPFNPIFLYGKIGSGKTHLLMGAAHCLSAAGKKCLFVTADTFTEHVVQAIRSSRMQEFRKIYRDLDVLLIDNIDQIARRTATQEEFFHTFNTLHTLGKQIVLSSIAPPSKLSEIESRLISRFEWGIAIGLEKADGRQILQNKARQWNLSINEELITFLLERFPSNPVLALQALALRIHAEKVISIDLAKRLLVDLLRKEEARAITPEKVVKALSAHFGIKASDLVGKSQMREFAFARQTAMYFCREILKMSFQAIGQFFGRDHSTVMTSVKQIQKGIDEKNFLIMEAVDAASRNLSNL